MINERFAVFHGIALALVLTGIWIAQPTAPKIDAEIQLQLAAPKLLRRGKNKHRPFLQERKGKPKVRFSNGPLFVKSSDWHLTAELVLSPMVNNVVAT